ncbi:glycosyltransferase family 4 protein [Tetragenococcus koreensis]|uniref:Glycosyltransferase n=1 Tax=Tetragenococcus koreensis TaxID=290335 RepID=A0AAN4RJZ8_9ENTE|nr:glycosyltransferase family 4 protein [Tetragenococcus koreensis]MCF1616276.1 glycosyltransferase family 4 protein [Tetragenococcus koreensis]MCF1620928.1 glycosyltransferase family 4 protein [Tetragenococcus koreensis]MCF1626140.1 glycosyltransferase family 4 protein [Tetragenococcus koreensis]MCF1631176.1 glycosyltransferase family 4 protein [Tetragenococcus koreensis]MCF1677057.1 glycosyltransferase family 4 protein [Tetragenococcus koreensis]
MKIGFFTDTYFPQVSGVATSIKTLKDELVKLGHEVIIFTTTDPNAPDDEEGIIRMPSVPFISFKDRRIVVRGMWDAYMIAKEFELDLVHTHTEFGVGFLGKVVGKSLHIPVVHTYHTMYEDYLHYIAHGKVLRPTHVKIFSRVFANHTSGVVCPSERVIATLRKYGVVTPMRIIPTGIETKKFEPNENTPTEIAQLRTFLGMEKDETFLLSLSRLSYEKNIQALIQKLPDILQVKPSVRLVIVGKGPYEEELKQLAFIEGITDKVLFVGEVPNDQVALYYQAADYFVCTSTSESQGLTYLEAMASGTQLVVEGNDYLDHLVDDFSLGATFKTDDEFASMLLSYMAENPAKNPEVLARKKYEISAESFGKSMLAFYNETIVYYEKVQAEKEQRPEVDTSTKTKKHKRLFKGIFH